MMPHTQAGTNVQGKKIRVWDLPTRLFHWSLAVLFCVSAYSGFQDKFDGYDRIHSWSGVAILCLLAWRLVWGLVGSDTARFSRFVTGPRAVVRYLKSLGRPGHDIVGHSPLAACSVLLMLILLTSQAVMGLFATDGMFFDGPLAGEVSSKLRGDLTGLHRTLGVVLIGLACVHVAAVLLYLIVKRTDLISPMITGKKRTAPEKTPPRMISPWAALVIFVPIALALTRWLL